MKTYDIKKVLVPVDFSPISSNALEFAIAICKRQLATLTLINVVENTFLLVPPEVAGVSGTITPTLINNAKENLSELAKTLRGKHDLIISHIVQCGNVVDEICDWAQRKEIDLIVMGTKGSSGIREILTSTHAYRVVKNSPCPVMTIPSEQQKFDFKKILFPVRMIPNPLDKYDVISPIIRKNKSTLHVEGVVKVEETSTYGDVKSFVESISQKIEHDNISFTNEVHYCDNEAKHVLAVSESEKPDLIVITTTQDTTWRDFFHGPYSQEIINHSNFPVLSIRSRSEDFLPLKMSSMNIETLKESANPALA